jgi:transcriptional regulator with XRE-family HTH domain
MSRARTHAAPIDDAVIGERIHTLMWRNHRRQEDLADLLGVDQGSVSRRMRGKRAWGAVDVVVTAQWLDVPVAELLLPRVDSNHQPFGQWSTVAA